MDIKQGCQASLLVAIPDNVVHIMLHAAQLSIQPVEQPAQTKCSATHDLPGWGSVRASGVQQHRRQPSRRHRPERQRLR
jgi:hypothetical protein